MTHENDHLYSRLSRARALPSLNLKKKGNCPIKTTVTNALVLILTGKYEMNNQPRAFRVKITRTCNSPSQEHGTWCHKSLRSVPSDPEEMVYYHFAEERTHEQCTCQKFCREVVPRFFCLRTPQENEQSLLFRERNVYLRMNKH